MKLAQLLSKVKTNFTIADNFPLNEVEVRDIAIDSRLVVKDSIFFALSGESKNGKDFINQAIKNGAFAIVAKNFNGNFPKGVFAIESDDPSLLLSELLNNLYSNLPNNIYAVTGTNGKTSVAEFTRQILEFLEKKSASIGTLGVVCKNVEQLKLQNSALTTPDVVSLYKNLSKLKNAGIDDVVIEASSIGLKQGRINGLKIDVGSFTNFTQDHIDYHKTMEEYFRCKMILFNEVLHDESTAILNSDIAEHSNIKTICQNNGQKIIEYGLNATDLKLKNISKSGSGQIVLFEFKGKKYQFNLLLDGTFQAFNVLCALGNVLAKNDLNEDQLQKLVQNFHSLHPALGRMQHIANLENEAQIFIDFAHSPDALINVLKLARNLTKSRVVVLFGCGGDRDSKKRPLMGKIACELADSVILTDDNPRTEDAANIRSDIIIGCDKSKVVEIAGRNIAIEKAISMLEPDDILILAGKGHEKYQIIGDVKNDFDEELIVRNALKK